MKNKLIVAGALLATSLLPALAGAADVPSAARPGTVNYVEGRATINEQALDEKSIGTTELRPGQALRTETGKAEVLLTPGTFVRLGEMSSMTMISPSLTNTQVRLDEGRAIVEVDEIHSQNNLQMIENGITTFLVKNGLYEFDADRQTVSVFDGQAVVQEGDRQIKLKGGHEFALSASKPAKAFKFDKKTAEDDDLYRWASLRSSYVAEANTDAARTYVVGGPSWFGEGWYWDPWFASYTFIPGDGIFYSPFGWGFYSPGFVYAAPFYYRAGYYRRFGPNYHAWGPGGHYGPPLRGARGGVRYGSRPGFGGGHATGGFGATHAGGFRGGASMGGMHR